LDGYSIDSKFESLSEAQDLCLKTRTCQGITKLHTGFYQLRTGTNLGKNAAEESFIKPTVSTKKLCDERKNHK
jgi:hypothetical protein